MSQKTVSVSRSVDLSASPHEVWAKIGNFQALDAWHPLVAKSREEHAADLEYRHLTIVDGAEITEQLTGRTEHSYSYRINSSPLPVEHYEAHLAVENHGGGSRVTWSSNFTPTADNAEEVIAGIYEAGFGELKSSMG